LGWPSQAPFDGILMTAASRIVPDELLDQLGEDGVLVMPLEEGGHQELIAIRRTEDGFDRERLGGVIFVPLLSGLA
jgi:protein-L-isoaspartate(D-aspartate) O-methyltransferase